jgi:protocatechuate 3,4-dioxygenase beta subunit
MRYAAAAAFLLVGLFHLQIMAAGIDPVDLKPFVGKTQFDHINAASLLPKGRQVIGGVPFQIDGIIELSGTSPRFTNPGRTNVTDIPIGPCERLHLLLACSRGGFDDGTTFARLTLHYADNSTEQLRIQYGRHARDWFGPRHNPDRPLLDPNTRIAWQAEHPAAASRDDHIRLFHTVLQNPNPTKEVRSISLEGARTRGGLMLAALSVGPAEAETLADTLPRPTQHTHPTNGQAIALSGRVHGPSGEAIEKALVRVLAVRPPGTNAVSILDHQAVNRETFTDSAGRFQLTNVSPDFVYRLLFAAQNFETELFDGADPLAGDLTMPLRIKGAKPEGFFVHGRLIGPDGKPVIGATVEPDGLGMDNSTSWGGNHGFPDRVVSDADGEFIMARQQPFTRLSVDVKAAGLAPANKVWLAQSNGVQEIKMGIGARIKGRVVKDGKPLPNMRLGIAAQERNSEVFQGHYETSADANGVFELKYLPPKTAWYLYGLMSSFKEHGSLRPRPVKSSDHGEVDDLGDLPVTPGLRLAGRVQSRDEQPLPPDARVRAGYETAWDSQSVRIDAEGRFQFEGLHPGQVQISLEPRTWKISARNRSLDLLNPWWLTGTLDKDRDDLVILMEPGRREPNSWYQGNGQLPPQDQPESLPLRGIEPDGSVSIVLSGKVVDDDTGKPLNRFTVLPGRKPPVNTATPPPQTVLQALTKPFRKAPTTPWNELPYWYFMHREIITNGSFSIEFPQLTSTPMLRIEADGYLSEDTPPLPWSTNMVVRLKSGRGPRGIILQPSGKPAVGAHVVFGAAREQYSLGDDGKLSAYGRDEWVQTTDSSGRFSFKPRNDGRLVFVEHASGWMQVEAEDFSRERTIDLQPWAVMSGRLVTTNGTPVANEKMALSMDHSGELPFVNIQERPRTDANGNFIFRRVPPGKLQLHRLVPSGPSSHSYQLQTPVYNKPGASNYIGNVILDTPPPPPVLKEFLKKLGL